MNDALRAALRRRVGEVSQAVLDRMYENRFWMERYGERGRRHADQDSLHHVRYLEEALAAGDPRVFEKYAVWLRAVLVSRGMCSEHLAENFRLLGEIIEAVDVPEPAAARAVLMAGAEALRYRQGEAGRLEGDASRLLEVIRATGGGHSMRGDDARYLVSYAIDAAATGMSQHYREFAARCPADAVAAFERAAAPGP